MRVIAIGAAAGAAGTTALNAVTYLDIAVRGRPSSDTPEQTVERLSQVAHAPVPGEGETRDNRVAGLGPLAGLVTGVGSGVLLALAAGGGVHVAQQPRQRRAGSSPPGGRRAQRAGLSPPRRPTPIRRGTPGRPRRAAQVDQLGGRPAGDQGHHRGRP